MFSFVCTIPAQRAMCARDPSGSSNDVNSQIGMDLSSVLDENIGLLLKVMMVLGVGAAVLSNLNGFVIRSQTRCKATASSLYFRDCSPTILTVCGVRTRVEVLFKSFLA